MAEANMSLEKLVSNSMMIASKFKDKMTFVGEGVNSVLGLKWSNVYDTFSYSDFGL